MRRAISRSLYTQIIRLYPEPFRREFTDEMLSMFDECHPAMGARHLLGDVLLSVARQQIQYLATPKPTKTGLYCEIASSPRIARIFSVAVFVLALIAGAFVGQANPHAESWVIVRPQRRLWYPSCWDQPATTRESKYVLTTDLDRADVSSSHEILEGIDSNRTAAEGR